MAKTREARIEFAVMEIERKGEHEVGRYPTYEEAEAKAMKIPADRMSDPEFYIRKVYTFKPERK